MENPKEKDKGTENKEKEKIKVLRWNNTGQPKERARAKVPKVPKVKAKRKRESRKAMKKQVEKGPASAGDGTSTQKIAKSRTHSATVVRNGDIMQEIVGHRK